MFAFKFEVRMKKCPCKNKTVQQTNSYFNYSMVQSAVHWHEHMPSALAATDPLMALSMMLYLNSAKNRFRDPSLRRFHSVPACDRQTDGRTDRQTAFRR